MNNLRAHVMSIILITAIISGIGHMVKPLFKSDKPDASRVEIWNCPDENSHDNYKIMLKVNNSGAENIVLRHEAGDIQCSK